MINQYFLSLTLFFSMFLGPEIIAMDFGDEISLVQENDDEASLVIPKSYSVGETVYGIWEMDDGLFTIKGVITKIPNAMMTSTGFVDVTVRTSVTYTVDVNVLYSPNTHIFRKYLGNVTDIDIGVIVNWMWCKGYCGFRYLEDGNVEVLVDRNYFKIITLSKEQLEKDLRKFHSSSCCRLL